MTPRCGPSTVRASCCSSSTTPSHLVWNGSEDRPSDEGGNCDWRQESRPARGRNPPGRSPLWSTAPSTTQLCARTVLARLGQRAVYSWKVQVPQTSLLLRWTLVSSTASTRKPCQSRPGAVSRSRASVSSTSSVSHAPVSAKVSSAFQSSGRFRASTDWVMVCSSTFNAKPVTHSTKRFHPGVVKHMAKGRSNSCQSDQNKRACIGHLSSARIRSGQGPSDMIRLRGVRVDPGDQLMSVRLLKIPGNYWIAHAPFRRLGPVRTATAGAHVARPAGLLALPTHRQQPLRVLLDQQRVDGPLQLPAGGELGPARTRWRRQAAQRRLGLLQAFLLQLRLGF